MVISSRHNSRIRQIRSLRSRRYREQTGLFFIEGVRLVAEALQMGAEIDLLVMAPELVVSPLAGEIIEQQRRRGAAYLEVSAAVFRTLADRNGPQGIGAVVPQRWERLESVRLTDGRCWVAVDAVQNPGNLGTILRTSEAVGGAGVILIGPTTDPYDPAAVRASLGTIFSQHLVRTTFTEFAAWKQRHRHLVVGTSPSAATSYKEVPYRPPLVLFMGSERLGLTPEMQAVCDQMVQIPMTGRCDSLNLGVATSIVLYEIFHQQRSAEADSPSLSVPQGRRK
jgi:TrmH family RNA methyltransferase